MFGLVPYKRNSDLRKRDSFWNIGDIVEEFFNDSLLPTFLAPVNSMRADIKETEQEYIVDVEIPGVNKEDIKLELKDDVLSVCVEKNEELKDERKDYIRRERRYGSCSRNFYVPNIKNENIKAKYESGILTVILPKVEEKKEKSHKINIE
jgi:HSP20 family protein